MKWYRWLVIIGFLVLLAGALIYGFMPRPVLVDSAAVSRGPLTVTIDAEGKTRVKQPYVISAPVAGTVRRIDLDVGDAVHKGQIVAWVEPRRSAVLDPRSRAQAQAQLEAAQASLQMAQDNARAAAAAADYARSDLIRLRRLRAQGVVSQGTLEQADAEARRTAASQRAGESAVQVARYQVKAARSALQYSAAQPPDDGEPPERVTLTAPINGRVLKVHQRSAFPVEPGTSLLEIGDPDRLEVAVDVLSADAVRIKPGDKVLLHRWGGTDLEGRVRVIEPVGFTKVSALGVEEQRVLVIVDFVSPHSEWRRLGDGYRVEASFILWHRDKVLQVPTAALLRNDDQWAVYRIEDGRARLRRVKLGERSDLAAQVLGGLEPGDRVIEHPADSIRDGTLVAPRSSAGVNR